VGKIKKEKILKISSIFVGLIFLFSPTIAAFGEV